MANVSYLKNNWAAGEISPRIMGRVELPVYQAGCTIMENMIPLPGGGAIRRPGTYYVGAPMSGASSKLLAITRALPYRGHILEFTHLHMRVWDAETHKLVYDKNGLVDRTTTYVAGDIGGLSGVPIGPELMIVHRGQQNRSGGSYALSKYSRTAVVRSDVVYSMFAFTKTDTPYLYRGIATDFLNRGIAAGMVFVVLVSITALAYSPISSVSSDTDVILTVDVLGTDEAIKGTTPQQYRYRQGRIFRASTSVLAGKLIDTNGEFISRAVVADDLVTNFKTFATAKVVTRDSATQLTLSADIFTEVGEPYTIVSQTYALATVTTTGARDFGGGTSGNWPSVVFACQGRLGVGGTFLEPDMVALSRAPNAATGAYRTTDFTLGTLADDAIIVYASDGKNGSIRWAASHRRLCLGTEFSTWQGPAGAVAATTFAMDYINAQACSNVPSVTIDKAAFYITSPKPRLHMLIYSQEGGGMMDVDLSLYSDHILEPGVVAMAAMETPYPIVWIIRSDGMLVSCTIDMSGGGLNPGWARHPMTDNAKVEDITSISEIAGDKLWLVVNRPTIGRVIEYLVVVPEDSDDFSDVHYVDCGKRIWQTTSATVTGLTHLNGCDVDAVADGGSMPQETVAGGSVTYDRTVSKVHIGLPYESLIRPAPPELQVNGTWQGKKKRVEEVTLRLLRTLGGKAGMDPDNLTSLPHFTPGVTLLGDPPTPFTGDVKLTMAGQVDANGAVYLVQDQPWPFTVLAAISKIAILEV